MITSRRALRRMPRIVIVLAWLLLGLAGCAASGSSRAYLLEQDFQRMSDAELTAYEQELSDMLAQSGRSAPGAVSLGVGFGSWGSHSGVGLGVGQTVYGTNGGGDSELRTRRDAVRAEMRRRGLLP